jgi:predicted phosphate transport protein (TIGR00153 family)
MRLLPREEKFYAFFLRQIALIVEAAVTLLEGVSAGNTHLAEAAEKIRNLEHRGDEVIHEVFSTLNQTFITPLDPEDIHSLASHLDNVLDTLEDAAIRMLDYRIEPISPVIVELSTEIVACVKALERAFDALNKNQKVIEHCIEVNRHEGIADEILRRGVRELFDTERDPIRIMKLKEIYDYLEATTDRCEDVADALQNVVVKNS